MGAIQNKTGKKFESQWADHLKGLGYWAYMFPNKQGQPCDIIAIKNNTPFFFECKTCNTDIFDCKRIEANQHTASRYIRSCGNSNYFIVIKFKSGINIYKFKEIENFRKIEYQEDKSEYEIYFK